MASTTAEKKLSLKLMLNKKTEKLIYAEASKEFVDFLFSILKLPLGTVNRLLTSDKMIGSVGNLYVSVENLSDLYMEPGKGKESLLKPTLLSNDLIPLLPKDIYSATTQLYKCSRPSGCSWYATSAKAYCKFHMYPTSCVMEHNGWDVGSLGIGGYAKEIVTYIVTDDLMVEPATPASLFSFLAKAGVRDLSAMEERTVEVGLDEALKLLKEVMVSKNVLTNVFLENITSVTDVKEEV